LCKGNYFLVTNQIFLQKNEKFLLFASFLDILVHQNTPKAAEAALDVLFALWRMF